MIISQERWDKTFKNFEVYDCTYGFEHGRVGLLLIEKLMKIISNMATTITCLNTSWYQ